MASFKLSFTAVLLCVAFSSCRGQGQSGGGGGAGAAAGGGGSGISAVVPGTQDSVQIVAQAALCFDNRPVLNGCLQAMGVNASGGKGGPSMPAPGAPAIMCSPPCFGHVTMMMSCVNSIFGNFATYNPGLMQGVQAVFQMSCGNVNGPAGGPRAGSGGAAGGAGGAGGAAGGAGGAAGGAGGAGGGVGSGAAGGIPNSIGGAAGGGGGAGGAAAGGIPNSIGGAGTGIVGGAGGGAGMGPAGGVAGGIPNSIGGAAAGGGGGAGAGGASGESGTVSSVGGAAGGGGAGNDTAIDGAVSTTSSSSDTNVVPLPPKQNAGSHVAVSNQSQPTSSADGPTFSLKGACSSMLLVISAGAWLMLV